MKMTVLEYHQLLDYVDRTGELPDGFSPDDRIELIDGANWHRPHKTHSEEAPV